MKQYTIKRWNKYTQKWQDAISNTPIVDADTEYEAYIMFRAWWFEQGNWFYDEEMHGILRIEEVVK